MLKSFLLPYGFKKIGWAIFVPTLLLGIVLLTTGFDADSLFGLFLPAPAPTLSPRVPPAG